MDLVLKISEIMANYALVATLLFVGMQAGEGFPVAGYGSVKNNFSQGRTRGKWRLERPTSSLLVR